MQCLNEWRKNVFTNIIIWSDRILIAVKILGEGCFHATKIEQLHSSTFCSIVIIGWCILKNQIKCMKCIRWECILESTLPSMASLLIKRSNIYLSFTSVETWPQEKHYEIIRIWLVLVISKTCRIRYCSLLSLKSFFCGPCMKQNFKFISGCQVVIDVEEVRKTASPPILSYDTDKIKLTTL